MNETQYSDQHIQNCGLERRGDSWCRPHGWGLSDNWEVEPAVRVPDDHARKILEHAALEAIVAKLPKTADGVPVVPWMKVYGFDADGNVGETVIGDSVPMCDDGDPQGEPFDEGDWFFGVSSGVFSTREAVEAAVSKEK